MTLPQLVGEDYKLSLIDEATVLYHTQGEDFISLVDHHINCQEGEEKYFFRHRPIFLWARFRKMRKEGTGMLRTRLVGDTHP